MSGHAEPRRYIAIIQDPQGYSAPGEPLETKENAPRRAECIAVVRAEEYDAAVAENVRLRAGMAGVRSTCIAGANAIEPRNVLGRVIGIVDAALDGEREDLMSGHVDGPFDPQKKMVDALRFYADERNWLNGREIRGFPGFHGRQIAANALAALRREEPDAER